MIPHPCGPTRTLFPAQGRGVPEPNLPPLQLPSPSSAATLSLNRGTQRRTPFPPPFAGDTPMLLQRLLDIQERHGHVSNDDLLRLHRETGQPLYRLEELVSC